MSSELPSGPWGLAVRIVGRVLAWVRQRPFLLAPWAWLALSVGALLIGTASALAGLPLLVVGACSLVAAVALLGSWSWWRLKRKVRVLGVVVARFRDENPGHANLATVHLAEVERRLTRNELLREPLSVHRVNAPLSEQHARRVMRHSRAMAVASGSGLAVAEHVRWEGWLLLRWPVTSGTIDRDEDTGEYNISVRYAMSKVGRSRLPQDVQFPAAQLTADLLPANHARAIEGAILVSVAARHDSAAVRKACLAEARKMAEVLPLEAAAALEVGEAFEAIDDGGSLGDAVAQLEAAGDAGINHIYLWNTAIGIATAGEQDHEVPPEVRVRLAEKACAAAPDDFIAVANLGIGHLVLDDPDSAIPHLEHALANAWAFDTLLAKRALTGAYRAVGRDADAWKLVADAYDSQTRREKKEMLRELGVTELEFKQKSTSS